MALLKEADCLSVPSRIRSLDTYKSKHLLRLHAHTRRRKRTRGSPLSARSLVIEANDLNKWGDTDGREGDTDPGLDDDGFEKDTLKLQETDIRVSSWLSDFCSENNPMEGDLFLLKLLRAQPATIQDGITKRERDISPSDLADRLIIVRHSLAKSMAAIPKYVASCNLEVYRQYVESGVKKDKPKYRGR